MRRCVPNSSGRCALDAIAGVIGLTVPGRLDQVVVGEQVGQEVGHDVVEHDGDDHLVRAGPGLELADQPADRRPAGEAAEHADDHVDHERQVDAVAEVGGHDGATDELALRADVEQARLVRQRDREPSQDQRRGLHAGFGQRVEHRGQVAVVDGRADRGLLEQRRDRVRVEDRALEQLHVRAHRGVPGQRDRVARGREQVAPGVQHGGVAERVDQPAHHQRGHQGQHRDDERVALHDRVQDEPGPARRPPVLARWALRLLRVLRGRRGDLGQRRLRLWIVGDRWPFRDRWPFGLRRRVRSGRLLAHVPAPDAGAEAAVPVPESGAAAGASSLPPAISLPSSSAGTVGGRKPVILPSYMTAIRSASA